MTLYEGIAKKIGNAGPGAGVTGLTYTETKGANVFVGTVPQSPNRCVSIIPTGGYPGDAKLPYDRPTFQVYVRGDEDARWALATARSIHSLLQSLRNVTLNDGDHTYLVSALALQSGPTHVGDDDNGRVQYSLNYDAEIRNPTIERPA